MATSTHTVGTDVAREYSTLTAWEVDQQRNLNTDSEVEQAECYDDGIMDDGVELLGWSTAASNYLRIYTPTAERHDGTSGSGFRLKYTATSLNIADVVIRENYVRVDGISFQPGNTGDAEHVAVSVYDSIDAANESRVTNCLIWGEGDSSARGIWVRDADSLCKIANCIVYDLDTTDVEAAGVYVENCVRTTIYNFTAQGNRYGIKRAAGTVIAKNCACLGNGTADFDGTFDAESNYNCSSDTTAPGVNSLISKTASDNFANVTPGNEDLHVKDTSADIYFSGMDLSTDTYYAVTDDIDGNARSIWCIGADEYQVGTASRALIQAKRFYSIYKNGLVIVQADCELVDIMTDLGDICTIVTGNPTITFSKALVYKKELLLGNTFRVRLTCLTGGWQFDEDNAWS